MLHSTTPNLLWLAAFRSPSGPKFRRQLPILPRIPREPLNLRRFRHPRQFLLRLQRARQPLPRLPAPERFVHLSAGIAVPQRLPVGTVMAISVDYERYAELKTSSRYALVVKSTGGEIVSEVQLQPSGNLSVFIQQFRPEHRPFTARIEELSPGSNRRTIVSNEVTLKTDY